MRQKELKALFLSNVSEIIPGSYKFNESDYYKKIGEFVVCFQWLENRIRQIINYCENPTLSNIATNNDDESNEKLLKRAVIVHNQFISQYLKQEDKTSLKSNFNDIINSLHQHRKFRNNLLHSCFHEMKVFGDVVDIAMFNRRNSNHVTNSNVSIAEDTLNGISKVMRVMGIDAVALNQHFNLLKNVRR
jgi:hypothetical protein